MRPHERLSGLGVVVGFSFALQPMTSLVAVDVFGMTAPAGSVLRLVLAASMFAMIGMIRLGSRGVGSHPVVSLRWAYAYLALTGCSIAWSEAASRAASSAYWLGTACSFGTVVLLLSSYDDRRSAAAAVMYGFVAGAFVVALTAWWMPAQADLRLGDEEYFNSNTIASICSFGVLFAEYLIRVGQRSSWWMVTLLSSTVLRSLSKTTILALVVAEVWLLLRDRSVSRRSKIFQALAGAGLLLIFSGLFIAYLDVYIGFGNQAETLTGRTAIWSWAFAGGLEKPWAGHGFDSMWKVAPVFGTFEARHAENELLQQFYAYGVLGLIALVGCYGALWKELKRETEDSGLIVLRAIILFVLVRGLAEAEPFDLLLPLWTVALIGTAALCPSADPCDVINREMADEQPGLNVIRL